MRVLILILSVLVFIGSANAQTGNVNVTTFKANGADTLDDTKAIQACIDYVASKGGGTVFFPDGTYYVSKQKITGKAICLLVKSNVSLLGEDKNKCILKLEDNQPGFSTILSVQNADDVSIKNFTIDGNYINQHIVDNEHSHGILIDESNRINVENCVLINTSGDGLGVRGVQTPSSNITVNNCSFNGNQREGLALGSGFKGITITNCLFEKDILHDPIHTEPNRGSFFGNVLIENNDIETPRHLTIVGTSPDTMATGYVIRNNTLKGSIYMIYASNITIDNNHIVNAPDKSAITILKTCNNIIIKNNQITVNNDAAFTITYASNMYSKNILIDSNTIYFNVADVPCFQIKGCDNIKISNNKIITQNNSKTLLEANATRSITGLEFSNNDVGYFQKNFDIKSLNNNAINSFSVHNNKFNNKSVLIDEKVKSNMQNTVIQNNH